MRWHDTGWTFPLEPIRDRYVTPYAGVSYELNPGEVGVNREALAANTKLRDDAEVVVAPGESRPGLGSVPLGIRPAYRVVPLDDGRPDALKLSPRGEAVFSSFELDAPAPTLLPWLRRGDALVLNAALARLFPSVKRVGRGEAI